MKTLFLNGKSEQDILTVGEILKNGGVVAIPTETVYGLAANALDETAVGKIFEAKGRPADNPLIVHIADASQLYGLVTVVPETAKKLAESFWPGPLTMILPKKDIVPHITTGGLDTVAVRFPSHPIAQAVIKAAGMPLAAPSANPSGRPSPTKFDHVRHDLDGRVNAVLDGGDCTVGVESTVVSLVGDTPRLLRPGGVTLPQLEGVLGRVDVDPAVLSELEKGAKAASPGMKYKHYSPKADVILVDGSPRAYGNYVNQYKNALAMCFDEDVKFINIPYISYGGRYSGEDQAKNVFSALYAADGQNAGTVYAHLPRKNGVGLAVYNRLIRSAGFHIETAGSCIVGLTGTSGSGKSTAAALLKEKGCFVIDCDKLTRSDKVYDSDCLSELAEGFGGDILTDGALNRKALAEKAFSTAESKKKLEAIVFPRIIKGIGNEIKTAEEKGEKMIVLDAPTLFEAGLDDICARIIVVTASEEVRLRRITARDGIAEEQARQRFSAQKSESFYTDRADFVITNNGAEDGIKAQIESIIDELESFGV